MQNMLVSIYSTKRYSGTHLLSRKYAESIFLSIGREASFMILWRFQKKEVGLRLRPFVSLNGDSVTLCNKWRIFRYEKIFGTLNDGRYKNIQDHLWFPDYMYRIRTTITHSATALVDQCTLRHSSAICELILSKFLFDVRLLVVLA